MCGSCGDEGSGDVAHKCGWGWNLRLQRHTDSVGVSSLNWQKATANLAMPRGVLTFTLHYVHLNSKPGHPQLGIAYLRTGGGSNPTPTASAVLPVSKPFIPVVMYVCVRVFARLWAGPGANQLSRRRSRSRSGRPGSRLENDAAVPGCAGSRKQTGIVGLDYGREISRGPRQANPARALPRSFWAHGSLSAANDIFV